VVNDIIPRAIEIANGDDMSQADVKAINAHTDDAVKRVIEAMNERAARERKLLNSRLARLRTALEQNASRTEVKQLLDMLAETLQHEVGPDRTDGDGDRATLGEPA